MYVCIVHVQHSLDQPGKVTNPARGLKVPYVCMYICIVHVQHNLDQPGKVTNPARGQLDRQNEYFPVRVPA